MSRLDKERQPVIIGVGRLTQHPGTPLADRHHPVGMLCAAARSAAADATSDGGATDGHPDSLLADLVAVGTPGMFTESRWRAAFGKDDPMYRNFSQSVAHALGARSINPALCWRSFPGGNGPQYLVNAFAERIALGNIPQGPILVGGVEENSTFDRVMRAGDKHLLKKWGWGDRGHGQQPPPDAPVTVNLHAKFKPEHFQVYRQIHQHLGRQTYEHYPLWENALQHRLGRTRAEHTDAIAELFSRFSAVAAEQPQHSWYPFARSAAFLKTPTADNRVMAVPYNKWMIARDEIDQSACCIMMSWAEAERRGVPRSKLVFLWGSGDAFDTTFLPLRRKYDCSMSMQAAYAEAFRSAGLGAPDHTKLAFLDLYSCYPVAVEAACEAVGLRDPLSTEVSRLTATGGLPYHGGPGSNYSSHGLAAVVEKLRLPEYRGQLAAVGANGGVLTEHSVGIYGTEPPPRGFERANYTSYAPDCALPLNCLALSPNGKGRVLTWTVRYKRKPNEPLCGAVIGEMLSGPDVGKRFVAKATSAPSMQWLLGRDPIGKTVEVMCDGKRDAKIGYTVTFAAPQRGRL